MNTFASAVSAAPAVSAHSSLFVEKEDFIAFKAHWKTLANARALTVEDAALRILVLGQDPLRSMPPTKNPTRIANGGLGASGLVMSMNAIAFRARMAQKYLDKQAAGAPIALAPFVEGWSKHGVSVELFASLLPLAAADHLKQAA